jgi:hypothetical protein
LDLTLPWETLAGCSPEPGYLGRLGPLTPSQAREVAEAAAEDAAVEWRVVLTNAAGQAIAVTRVPAARAGPVPSVGHERRAGAAPGLVGATGLAGEVRLIDSVGLIGRVTLTIPEDILPCPPPPVLGRPGSAPVAAQQQEMHVVDEATGSMLDRALRAARRASAAAAERAIRDSASAGGCTHTGATPGYRPAPRLREFVVARDLTCRFPFCRQPAWRGDLDHTQPWDRGGLTCSCNLGGLCRAHHILKQHPGWQLIQSAPGLFRWTTPAGRSYAVSPDIHLA